ncbi:MAG: anthranilate synthase component I family protein [Sedimentisphaerales bacterium]|jgi:para-aminobenzoate synthetase component 1
MTTATLPITHKTPLCQLHCRRLRADIDPASLSEAISKLPGATILGGNPSKSEADGFSYWMSRPVAVFEFRIGQKEPFTKLQRILKGLDSRSFDYAQDRLRGNDKELPNGIFTGGWVGCFSYDLGRYIEPSSFTGNAPKDDLSLPLIRLCFYDRLIAYDHRKGDFWLLALHLADETENPEKKLDELQQQLASSQNITVTPAPADMENIEFSRFHCNMSPDYYFNALAKIKRHIYDGDVYQINFSQRFDCVYHARPIDLFHWQNRYNPSPYSAYIDAGPFQIVSASPEMFITTKDRIISTKPIKGTRKRLEETSAAAKQINAENLRQLLDSAKEKAELNMIIDLERNDIARICKPGTRKVVQPRTIETNPSVFHAVATVAGEMRDDVDFCDILKAMFPGGSITGAPKIRAMQIINETEPTDRGIYTGSIGYIGLDGSISLNIAIRTIIIKNQSAYVQTGGGIVADSDPKAEYEETITKARALIAGIRSVMRRA